jgi:dienelactone hydrolase
MRYFATLVTCILASTAIIAAEPLPGDKMFADYFRAETEKIRDACLTNIKTLDDWNKASPGYRKQLFEMLGLAPLLEKSELKATVTGEIEKNGIVVEKIHFQSRPGLYVTANLYRPKEVTKPLPTVLYLCGHSQQKKGNVSFGNKVGYQHHGIWFARNGYVCLMLDSLQLGEIEGIHHGTYRYDMWWWINRGYTPAGVEAWNCIRALDYLETRPEVDKKRIGATGRSGGGAYTWFIAALDERIQCAVPVAGITDLQNHVIDGVVEGHCDCMYFHNTYQWDYPQLAALVAPRPLLIGNTDADPIFPLDGVKRTYEKTKRIYDLHSAGDKCELVVFPGGHNDLPELQTAAFAFFNRHLKQTESPIENVGEKWFEPEELCVFGEKLPEDSINAKLQEVFVPVAKKWKLPADQKEWQQWTVGELGISHPSLAWQRREEIVFKGEVKLDQETLQEFEFTPNEYFKLPIFVRTGNGEDTKTVELHLLSDDEWVIQQGKLVPKVENNTKHTIIYFSPRGIGPTATNPDSKKRTQLHRRFQLLGTTIYAEQVAEVMLAIQGFRRLSNSPVKKKEIHASGLLAGVALSAVLSREIDSVQLTKLSTSFRQGPYFWNVDHQWDMPQAVAKAAQSTKVTLHQANPEDWQYPLAMQKKLGWPKENLVIVPK